MPLAARPTRMTVTMAAAANAATDPPGRRCRLERPNRYAARRRGSNNITVLLFAARDALRAGSLFLAESRNHVSFWNLVYDDRKWQQTREQAYQRLDLPIDGQAFLAKITAEFDRAARAAERGLPGNRFASIVNGRLKLKKRDALADLTRGA